MLTLEKKTVAVAAHSVCPYNNQIMTITAQVDGQTLVKLLLDDSFYLTIIPKTFNEMFEEVQNDPFIPIHWSKADVTGNEMLYHNEEEVRLHLLLYEKAIKNAVNMAYELHTAGNAADAKRLIGPYVRYAIVMTSTKWGKFFENSCPQYQYDFNGQKYRSQKEFHDVVAKTADTDVQRTLSLPNFLTLNKNKEDVHIQSLAENIWDRYKVSEPKKLTPGQWHMPFEEGQKDFPSLSFHFAKVLTVADHNKEAFFRYNKYEGFLPHGVILGL